MNRILALSFLLSGFAAAATASPYRDNAEEEYHEHDLASKATPYLAWHKELAQLLEEIGQCLERVRDEASATAAAPQMPAFTQRLSSLLEQEKALPQPSAELGAYVERQLTGSPESQKLAERSYGRIFELMTDIEPPCYGSQALQEALHLFLRSITERE